MQKCTLKTTDWLATNLHGIGTRFMNYKKFFFYFHMHIPFVLDIFSKDIPGDAEKLLKIPLAYEQRFENSFTLRNSKSFPSDTFGKLQVTDFKICNFKFNKYILATTYNQ